jgi:hypothetical protein
VEELAQGFKVTLEIVDKPPDELLERPKTPRAFADRDRECYYVTTDYGSSDDERNGGKPPEPDIPVDAHRVPSLDGKRMKLSFRRSTQASMVKTLI